MSATPTAIGSGPAWPRRLLGEANDQLRVARGLAVASAVVVFVATTVLIATHDLDLIRAAKAPVQARVLRIDHGRVNLAGAHL